MYARRLAQPTWKVADYMGKSTEPGPSLDVLKKIIRLAGVSADPHEIQADLKHQLQFVEVLQSVDTDALEPLSRIVAPVTCPEPEGIPEAQDPVSWSPTSLAAKQKNNYFIVEKQLGE